MLEKLPNGNYVDPAHVIRLAKPSPQDWPGGYVEISLSSGDKESLYFPEPAERDCFFTNFALKCEAEQRCNRERLAKEHP